MANISGAERTAIFTMVAALGVSSQNRRPLGVPSPGWRRLHLRRPHFAGCVALGDRYAPWFLLLERRPCRLGGDTALPRGTGFFRQDTGGGLCLVADLADGPEAGNRAVPRLTMSQIPKKASNTSPSSPALCRLRLRLDRCVSDRTSHEVRSPRRTPPAGSTASSGQSPTAWVSRGQRASSTARTRHRIVVGRQAALSRKFWVPRAMVPCGLLLEGARWTPSTSPRR